MKLKSLLFAVCFSLVGHAFAANQHVHPKANEVDNSSKNSLTAKSAMLPGYCEIEIYNTSYVDAYVHGVFDDRTLLTPFVVYSMEAPHYISLHYYGYCHGGMELVIQENKFPYYEIYHTWTTPGTTIRIQPYLNNNLNGKNDSDKSVKVEVTKK